MELKHHRLSNGLGVAVLPNPNVKAACLLVDIHSGSRNDRQGKEGEHHAFEHMPFRGTLSFPNKLAWAVPLERHGVNPASNINTGLCRTRFSLHVPTEQLQLAASHLSELAYCPLLRKKDWELERSAIIREWEEQQNDGGSAYLHQLLPIMFPDYPQLQVGPLGTPDSINAITVDDLTALHSQDYTVNNSQLVLTGNITDAWLDVLEKTFGRLKLSVGGSSRQQQQVVSTGGKKYSVSHELFPQPFLGINGIFQVPDDRVSAALSIFVTMLADGCLSSPIFGELREKRGLVYSYGVDIDRLMPGLLRIYFECNTNHANLAEVEKRFWEIVEQTSRDQERFAFAKDRKLGKMSMRVFDPEAEADDIADQLLLDGYYVPDEEQESVIGSLQFEEVATVASTYFDRSKFFALTMRR